MALRFGRDVRWRNGSFTRICLFMHEVRGHCHVFTRRKTIHPATGGGYLEHDLAVMADHAQWA